MLGKQIQIIASSNYIHVLVSSQNINLSTNFHCSLVLSITQQFQFLYFVLSNNKTKPRTFVEYETLGFSQADYLILRNTVLAASPEISKIRAAPVFQNHIIKKPKKPKQKETIRCREIFISLPLMCFPDFILHQIVPIDLLGYI